MFVAGLQTCLEKHVSFSVVKDRVKEMRLNTATNKKILNLECKDQFYSKQYYVHVLPDVSHFSYIMNLEQTVVKRMPFISQFDKNHVLRMWVSLSANMIQ